MQEMRISLQDLTESVSHQKVELDLMQEKFQTLMSTIDQLKDDLSRSNKTTQELSKDRLSSLEKRVASLEKTHEVLLADLKTLKDHLNSSETALRSCEGRLTDIDKHLTSDISSLKTSLQSMLSLLQKGAGEASGSYTVKPGDSLGQIAVDHRTTVRQLRELNGLTSDQIRVGQKLKLPE